ncbi:MAG: MipA/OmpV family protein [Pseudomonadota bacterium]
MINNRKASMALAGLMIVVPVLSVWAQDSAEDNSETPPGWIVGLAYIAAPDPYVGSVDDASTVVPLIGYIGERLTWIGPSLQYTLLDVSALQLGIEASYRFEGFDDDNMLNRELERRSGSLDIGLTADYGPFSLEVATDASDTHNGAEATFGASLDYAFSDRLSLSPALSVTYKNANLANYYYGVSQREATTARPAYTPGSAVNVTAGVELNYAFSPRVLITLGVDVEQLDRTLRDSPLINSNRQVSAFAGVLVDLF